MQRPRININKTSEESYPYRAHFSLNGKRYQFKGKTKKEVHQKASAKLDALLTVTGSDMLLADWSRICIDTYKTGQKVETRRIFQAKVDRCILRELGQLPLSKITPLDCQRTLNMLTGYSKSYINDIYQALRFLFGKAYVCGHIPSDPTVPLVKPAGKQKDHRRALTSDEQDLVLSEARKDRLYYLYLLMLQCGCRPSEAAECKGSDIETVQKNGKFYHLLHIRGTKTAQADRRVPLPDDLYELIKSTPPDEYISCHRSGTKFNEDKRNKNWDYFLRKLDLAAGAVTYRNRIIESKIAPDLVPYMLRHTYCTNLAKKGIDIRIAQKLMGHSDIKLTANIYTHVDADDILTAAAEILKQAT